MVASSADGMERCSHLQRVLNHAQDMLWTTDFEGRVTWVSRSVLRLLGWDEEDSIGRTVDEYMTPESRRIIGEAIRGAITAEPPLDGIHEQVTYIHRDGHEVPCELRMTFVRDDAGRIVELDGVSRDVTRERSLASRLSWQAAILDQSDDAIATVDFSGRFTHANEALARMLGRSRESLIGSDVSVFPEPEDGLTNYDLLSQVRAVGQYRGERALVAKDGTNFVMDLKMQLRREGEGTPTGILAIGRDVTDERRAEAEQRRLEDQLSQSRKMEAIGRLAGGVAHDFNNMLTAIGGFADVIAGALTEGDPIREDVEEIRSAADKAGHLTRQLLTFSRRQLVHVEPLDLNRILGGVDRILSRMIGEDIRCSVEPAEDLWTVRADRHQLEQVLVNLGANARDAMEFGGELRFVTSNATLDPTFCADRVGLTPGDFVRLSAEDSGEGMTAETIEQIFEPFFTTREGHNTGLGLATVYGIVKQADGHIEVHSTPGQGTRFDLYFPRVLDSPQEAGAPEPIPAAPPASGTVLVVEDDPPLRRLTRRVLERAGYRVLDPAEPSAAIQICEDDAQPLDLLITDIIMPEMDGRDLAVRVQELRPGLPMVFVSGYSEEILDRRPIGDNSHFLPKPFSVQELTELVQEVLGARRP